MRYLLAFTVGMLVYWIGSVIDDAIKNKRPPVPPLAEIQTCTDCLFSTSRTTSTSFVPRLTPKSEQELSDEWWRRRRMDSSGKGAK